MGLYETFDKATLTSANYLTTSYNWVTGRTKKQISNDASLAGNITSMGALYAINPTAFKCVLPFSIAAHLTRRFTNMILAAEEKRDLEKQVADVGAEYKKEKNKKSGCRQLGVSLTSVPVAMLAENPAPLIIGAGIAIDGLSKIILSADNVSPRRNCIYRSLSKLTNK